MTEAALLREQPEGRGAFGGFIGPRTLVGLVQSAAPYLFDAARVRSAELPQSRGVRLCEHAFHSLGWWSILLHADLLPAQPEPTPEARTDYFALCLAAHWASVASYVPTDVDAKIRHALWFEAQPAPELARMRDLALNLKRWDMRGFSARIVDVPELGPVSGHDGERLSVLCGGMLGLLAAGDQSGAQLLEDEIDAELAREAAAFERVTATKGSELALVDMASILTHNAGDVMQGLAAKSGRHVAAPALARFGELARERFGRYSGAFGKAAAIYRELSASEGHRNYPLRAVKLLRADPELMLPLGPCLDAWGARLARWPHWTSAQRAQVIGAVIDGCRKVAGQEGYYRALAGFDTTYPGGIQARDLAEHYTTSVRHALKDAELRRKIAVRRESFESSLAKRARAILSRG